MFIKRKTPRFPPIDWHTVHARRANTRDPHNYTDEDFKHDHARKIFAQLYGNGPEASDSDRWHVDDDVANESEKQMYKTARSVADFLNSIGDKHYTGPIWKAMANNVPDIKKYHEYKRNRNGSYNIDWYDRKGKSTPHLKWDANYWHAIAVGYNKNNRDYDDAFKWWLYHENKLVAYETNPSGHRHGIQTQTDYLTKYQHLMDANHDTKMDSWLSKIHDAQHWAEYHQHKIDDWVYNRPKYQHRINVQTKLRDKWLAKAKQFTQFKNNALRMENMYKQAMNARRQAKLDAQINAQVSANSANNLTSIYRADHQDPTVIAVSELSPNENLSMNLPTKAIDKDLPEGDFANVSETQLSGTYYAFIRPGVNETGGYGEDNSPGYADRVKQFKTLLNWTKGNHRVVVRGFSLWTSAFIQSIGRQMDANGAANSLEMSITFQYQRVATIKTAKQKASASPKKGRARKRGHRPTKYKIKPGDNLYKIAHGNVRKVNAIRKANPGLKNPNLIYPGHRLVIPK